MTRFLLIRHATTDALGKRFSGRLPGVHLNEEGNMQALQLRDRIAGLPITHIYSSPLERAVETADPLARQLNLKVIIEEDFLELNLGDWTNATFEQLNNNATFQQFNSFRSCTRIPGGELMLEAQMRIVKAIQSLQRKHQNETIAVITHSDLIKACVAYYAGIHLDMFHRIEISPASVSILEIYEDTARILLINHTGAIEV